MSISNIVSEQDLQKMEQAIVEYNELKKEIKLFNNAKMATPLTEADIDKKIADLQLAIDVFRGKR